MSYGATELELAPLSQPELAECYNLRVITLTLASLVHTYPTDRSGFLDGAGAPQRRCAVEGTLSTLYLPSARQTVGETARQCETVGQGETATSVRDRQPA